MTDALEQQTTAPVQAQLDAYNAKDIEAFCRCYHADISIYRMPASAPALQGLAALRHFYATERFTLPALRAEVLNRLVAGNKVVDHERVYGMGETPSDVIVVYEVDAGLIRSAWFYPTG